MARFHVNGDPVDFRGPADTPLLWILRDQLGLTGTKYACGAGACGSCTVHVDGEPAQACAVPASALEGKRVVTIEGITATTRARVARAVQAAWVDKDVVQCGYCQPAQVMAATALLVKHPAPTDAQLDAAMQGVLCRCGTYQRVREAVKAAAAALGKAGS